jgi:hypothetical protein
MAIVLYFLALLLGVFLNYKSAKFWKKMDKFNKDD